LPLLLEYCAEIILKVFYTFCKTKFTTLSLFAMQSSRHLFDEMRYFILSREIHQELLLQAEKSVKKEIVKPKLSAVRDGQQKENKKNKN